MTDIPDNPDTLYFIPAREAARLYKVSIDQLRGAVRRNLRRFPGDLALLTLGAGAMGMGPGRPRRVAPNAFTPAGILMLSTVLPGRWAALDHIALIRRAESIGVVPERLTRCRTFVLREQIVFLDGDLAAAYLTTSGRLLTVFGANRQRFPPEFGFLLSEHEMNCVSVRAPGIGAGYQHRLPWAFTAAGASMLASLLRGPDAVAATLAMVQSVAAAGTGLPALDAPPTEWRDVTA
jgi:hypothetical protein